MDATIPNYSHPGVSYSLSLLNKMIFFSDSLPFRINDWMKKSTLLISGLSVAVGVALCVVSAVPTTILGGSLAIGVFTATLMNSMKISVHRDDAAWLGTAALVLSFIVHFPICAATGAALFLLKNPSKAVPPPGRRNDAPDRVVHRALNQKMRDYIGVHSSCKSQTAKSMEGILEEKISELRSLSLNEKRFTDCYNEFAIAYEAYVRIVVRKECGRTFKDVYSYFKEHDLISFWKEQQKIVEGMDPQKKALLYAPPLAASCEFDNDGSQVLMLHSTKEFEPCGFMIYNNMDYSIDIDTEVKKTREDVSDGYYCEDSPYASFVHYDRPKEGDEPGIYIGNTTKKSILKVREEGSPDLERTFKRQESNSAEGFSGIFQKRVEVKEFVILGQESNLQA